MSWRKSHFLSVELCKKNPRLYTAMKSAVTLYLVCKLQKKKLVISLGSAGSAGSAVPRSAVPQISASLLRRGSAEKSECRRKIPWKATAGASARNHAQYGCDPGESFCN